MTSKEWVKNELSLSDDCLTTTDRVMLSKVLQDLERLEEFEKVLNGHCSKCVNRENNVCVGMDASIHIDTLINCIEMLSTELQKENQELRKIKEKAICEMQKARKKMNFYAQSEQYKEMYAYFNGVYKGLQEVLENDEMV